MVKLQTMALACFVFLAPSLVVAQEASPNQDVQSIVAGMIAARRENGEHVRAFTVKRDYQLFDQQLRSKAHVIASIMFIPPDHKRYSIEGGRGGGAEKILRDIVVGETDATKDGRRHELSPENYEFQLNGLEELDGRLCYKLAIRPRRQERDLIRGHIWVDKENYRVHRVEGDAAKNPSWWVHDLHILIAFSDVEGMWLRTFMRAVATVRFKGKYVVEARDLEYLGESGGSL
jgi:hypothetical protein